MEQVAEQFAGCACKDLTDIRTFLGTIGIAQIFIKDFAKCAHPLIYLTRKEVPFKFGPQQISVQEDFKHTLIHSLALRPINY